MELLYQYSIADLSLLPQKTGEPYFTPTYFSKSHPNMKWRLQIYPNGVTEEVQDYLSLFLNRADIGEEEPNVVAVFKILRKEQIHSRLSQPTQQYNHLSPSFGLLRCVHLDLFKNEKSKESSSLKIICHLICEVQRTWVTNFAKYLIPI